MVVAIFYFLQPQYSASGVEDTHFLPQGNNSTATLSNETLDVVSIATWNLEIFGRTEAEDEVRFSYIVDQISQFDIVAIQEIRDSTGLAIEKLCTALEDYSCIVSERTGYTTSKEQYAFIYKDVELVNFFDHYKLQSQYSRPPYEATFELGSYNLTLITMHTVPDDATEEISKLSEKFISRKEPTILLGDLNADCNYYPDPHIETHFFGWKWIIPDDEDTNMASTNCAYDRVIANDLAYTHYLNYTIIPVDDSVSDHKIVEILVRK